MEENTPKTANQLYKEARLNGSQLSFSEWITQNKGNLFIKNDSLSALLDEAKQNTNVISRPVLKNDKIFGLNKNVIIVSAAIIIISIGYKLYSKK